MFLRHSHGLPPDPSFPSDLESLGYFVNDEDEIRSSENSDYYFKYHLNRNDRINLRQSFAFDQAVETIIHERLQHEGLKKVALPLGTESFDEKHVPIFMDENLDQKNRVVIVFGESDKPLGLLAGRVANGRGGINKGSMVSVVRELQKQQATDKSPSAPGIVLANTGQRYWWPEGKRALTVRASSRIPLPSMVHSGHAFVPELNDIPGHETVDQHIQSVFDDVIASKTSESSVLDVIAIGGMCHLVQKFLDHNWDRWGSRFSTLLLVDTICEADELVNDSFKQFLEKRSRCYLLSAEPIDTLLAPPIGNHTLDIKPLGVPCYSASEPDYTECILITALKPMLSYLERNALCPGAENHPKSLLLIPDQQDKDQAAEVQAAALEDEETWAKLDDDQKPPVHFVDPGIMEKERKQRVMWEQFEETGEAPDPILNFERQFNERMEELEEMERKLSEEEKQHKKEFR